MTQIEEGTAECQEWEPAGDVWNPDVKHLWQAQHIKVVEFAVAACGLPLAHTKFPFAEGEHEISQFLADMWPATNQEHRPSYIVIDKACKVMPTLHARNELVMPGGWLATTRFKVETWHYTCHDIDELCVNW
ncbi:hypothetical protein K439DRAFT_1365583 [Ramaria rubella]|nr:hypothetical protein K439DRAFT_1365583 [Ramaria rubella]